MAKNNTKTQRRAVKVQRRNKQHRRTNANNQHRMKNPTKKKVFTQVSVTKDPFAEMFYDPKVHGLYAYFHFSKHTDGTVGLAASIAFFAKHAEEEYLEMLLRVQKGFEGNAICVELPQSFDYEKAQELMTNDKNLFAAKKTLEAMEHKMTEHFYYFDYEEFCGLRDMVLETYASLLSSILQ